MKVSKEFAEMMARIDEDMEKAELVLKEVEETIIRSNKLIEKLERERMQNKTTMR